MTAKKQSAKQKVSENPMRKMILEKVTLSSGAVGGELDKAKKLLELLTEKKAQIIKSGSKTRIPDFGVKPNMELGTRVTLRKEEAKEILRRLLVAVDNTLSENQISDNTFSFGIKEYIEIPGIEYQRDIGIRGLNVTVTFIRKGVRVKRKKLKYGKLPEKQNVSQEEIIKYLEENFNAKIR